MNIGSVRLRDFRNHADSRLDFGDRINILIGNNAQGKTNVLEALSYLSLTKSFYAASDDTALKFGCDRFELEGTICTVSGNVHVLRCVYTRSTHEKVFTVNGAAPKSLGDVIGRFPVVILSPEHGAITSGGPAERRRFLDITLSQVSRAYFEDLMEYRRVLRQRNRLLFNGRTQKVQRADVMEPWDLNLIKYGSSVIRRRCVFLDEIAQYVKDAYAALVEHDEEPSLRYVSSIERAEVGADAGGMEMAMRLSMERLRNEEIRRGVSLVGPHRDDIQLSLSGRAMKDYASQGQHKTFLVALKLAEFFYVRERKQEAPMFLLDDVFSELDTGRVRRIVELVSGLGQTIMTTTDEAAFHAAVQRERTSRRFYVENGTCREA